MSNHVLDRFGQFLMENVRDRQISICTRLIEGTMKGVTQEKIKPILSDLTEKELSVFIKLLPIIVDIGLHEFLFALTEQDDISILVETNDGGKVDINEESDGLHGELFTTDGWIYRFSKYPEF